MTREPFHCLPGGRLANPRRRGDAALAQAMAEHPSSRPPERNRTFAEIVALGHLVGLDDGDDAA